jgi:hypothetical protein
VRLDRALDVVRQAIFPFRHKLILANCLFAHRADIDASRHLVARVARNFMPRRTSS